MAMVLPLFTFIGCSDDESANSQKVMINLYWKYENLEDTKIASPSIVALYDYEEAKILIRKHPLTLWLMMGI